jgi:uncharacterized membrane protein (GlpM family)
VNDLLIVLVKALLGGTLVVAFAVLAETVSPKRFAGLFGAAPAVALSSLTLVLITKNAHDARESAIGMLAGCVGMACYAAATVRLIRDRRVVREPILGLVAWFVPTGAVASLLLL